MRDITDCLEAEKKIKTLQAQLNYLRNPFDPDCATQEFWKKELPHVFKAWLAERHKVNGLEAKLCKALEALRPFSESYGNYKKSQVLRDENYKKAFETLREIEGK